jgi:hypothetical protein
MFPVIGGERFGGIEAPTSDEAAAGEVEIPGYCIRWIGCMLSLSALIAFRYQDAGFTAKIDGGNVDEYATVAQAATSSARADGNRRSVHVPGGKQLTSPGRALPAWIPMRSDSLSEGHTLVAGMHAMAANVRPSRLSASIL